MFLAGLIEQRESVTWSVHYVLFKPIKVQLKFKDINLLYIYASLCINIITKTFLNSILFSGNRM